MVRIVSDPDLDVPPALASEDSEEVRASFPNLDGVAQILLIAEQEAQRVRQEQENLERQKAEEVEEAERVEVRKKELKPPDFDENVARPSRIFACPAPAKWGEEILKALTDLLLPYNFPRRISLITTASANNYHTFRDILLCDCFVSPSLTEYCQLFGQETRDDIAHPCYYGPRRCKAATVLAQ
ncbi:hypothetical protein A0H81_07117 [Grifola frondosa]|uniref:Uncharacterized protein n=1 Tax=Grifola frondosa TaxID=5627 RepID=A0A1C7M9B1_GRIFR|nr:hypothetical protein A0H81_07117 [Grifola frondosa]